jgi:hypothetical protein
MSDPLSPITSFAPETIATATLVVDSSAGSFTEITGEAMRFVSESRAVGCVRSPPSCGWS